MRNVFWPDITDLADAKKVAKSGAAAAFFVSLITFIVTFGETQGMFKLFGVGPEAYIDAGLFLIIGIGILFMSRIAAIAGLGLYGFEQVVMLQSGKSGMSILAIYFILCFINAIRACFDYHTMKKQGLGEAEAAPTGPVSILTGQPIPGAMPAAEAEPEKKKFPVRTVIRIIGGIILVAAILGAAGAFFHFSKNGAFSKTTISSPNSISEDMKGAKTFHMKSGETIRGHVTVEDPDLYIVKVNGKDEVLARADIESVE